MSITMLSADGPKGRACAGFTLVEVVVGMLMVAMLVGPMFSVAVTTRMSKAKVDQRIAAAAIGNRLLDQLKLFVTADSNAAPGPNGTTYPNGWGLSGDSCHCYALAAGQHTLDPGVWAPELAGAGGAIGYSVATVATGGGNQPTVTLSISWNQ